MKLSLFLLLTSITFPLVSSCTPDQINSAIEACKGDPACYEIIDDAIEEELATRGITGGRMTNVEYERVKFFLETYTIGFEEHQYNFFKMTEIGQKSYYLDQHITYASIMASMDLLANDFYYDYGNASNRLIPNLDIFALDIVNPNQKQLFYTGANFDRVKHVLFKTGSDTYSYEIFGENSYVFSIDLELESIFFRDKRYISPHSIYLFFKEELNWEDLFQTPPTLINEYFQQESKRFENDKGYFIERMGTNYSNDGIDGVYGRREVPFFSIEYYSVKENINLYISSGAANSENGFNHYLTLSINEYKGDSLFQPSKKANLTMTMSNDHLNQEKALSYWIELLKEEPIFFSEYLGYTKAQVFSIFESSFSVLLNNLYSISTGSFNPI
jgi:hypothetical protein